MRRPLLRLAGLAVAGGVVLAAALAPVAVLSGTTLAAAAGAPVDPGALADPHLPAATTITDATGAPIARLYDQDRDPVPSAMIAPAMKGAIIAVEDRRFLQHGGVDPVGTLRALLHDAAGGDRQGGSTLTQQYVKNYLLYVTARTDAEREAATAPSLRRKLDEARLALAVDHAASKDTILTGYLNLVAFGRGFYGVQAAARGWFATSADRLTIPQAALLAGMVQSPATFDPLTHPEVATQRRDLVIGLMRDQGMIDDAQAAAATAAPLGVVADPTPPPRGCTGAGGAGFFCTAVVAQLAAAGIDPDQLTTGGYTVRTTLDPRAQAAAEAAVAHEVSATAPHAADVLSVVEPGAAAHPVRAMAASRHYGTGPGATLAGLPYEPEGLGAGSVYKIFTAASALEQGVVGIDSTIDVPPSGYLSPIYKGAGNRPVPVDNAGDYPPQLTLSEALALSPNTAFVALEERTGIAPVVEMAERLGMTSLTVPFGDGPPPGQAARSQASFTLGVSPTSGLELANVMATLAAHGTWCPPQLVTSVTGPDGAAVPIPAPPCRQAVDPALADSLMAALGHDDTDGGTSATAAGITGWHRPVAAKTGTTQRNQSASFVAATPTAAAAAIVFDDSPHPGPLCDGSPPHPCSGGNLFGGTAPARTVYRALGTFLAGQPAAPLPEPDPRYLDARE
ncbi:MAG: transglycosylase domain-containing protein [Pseudonocardia sp.]